MRIRSGALLVVGLVVLTGCRGGEQDGEHPAIPTQRQFLGEAPGCQETPTRALTAPVQQISVEGDEVLVEPDSVVQPTVAGVFAWTSDTHSWSISYTDGESPTVASSYSGEPGDTVWAAVREDAGCRYYKYELEVWSDDREDTLRIDPGSDVEPFEYSG